MNLVAELARFTPDPALLPSVTAWREQAQQDALALDRSRRELRNAELKIQALVLELAQHKRLRFGRASEALSAEQRQLFEETGETDLGALEAELEAELEQLTPATASPRKTPRGRQPLPAHLPRIEYRHEPDTCTCGQCGHDLVLIGEDVSEQLDVEPARFFVQRHLRPQYACRTCERVAAAPIPAAVIDGSLAAPGLLAWVVIQKYVDHLPLYRIEQISERHGAGIARSTLADWVGRIGVALQPLVDRLADRLRERPVLHADETPVAQLDPGAGKTLRAYLWAYRSNDLGEGPPLVVFDYQTSRAGHHVRTFLNDWQGHLMVDDYAGYKALFQGGHGNIVELGCLAHARRKFFELFAANRSAIAAEALRRIAALYAIEQNGRALNAEDRRALRQQQAKPELDALRDWLIRTRATLAEGGGTARAIDYTLKRWPALIRYVADGRFPIDNNAVENSIRPIAIGRKNWLFAGSERAGIRAAAIQSLLGTAKLNGIEPYAWLKETLEKLPTWPNSRIDALLPLRSEIND